MKGKQILPRKLTGNYPKMEGWKMIFLFKQVIFRFHVRFRESKTMAMETSTTCSTISCCFMCTPKKFEHRYHKIAILKRMVSFSNHHFGCPYSISRIHLFGIIRWNNVYHNHCAMVIFTLTPNILDQQTPSKQVCY